MPSQWFCRVQGKEVGPVTFQDLVEMVRAGRLSESDRVRRETGNDWIPAREVIGLFRAAAAGATPAPSAPPPSAAPPPAAVPPAQAAAEARQKPQAEAPPRPAAASASSRPKRSRRIEKLVWLGSFAVALIAIFIVRQVWLRRIPQFPEPRKGNPRPASGGTLEALLGTRPTSPSIPGLKQRVATPIPGLEEVDPGYSPCLSPDLKTIVYTALVDYVTFYDLYVATREDVSKPFGKPKLIEGCKSLVTEAYPTLSADGLELIFQRGDNRPQLFRSVRASLAGDFGKAVLWPVPNHDPAKQRIHYPQLLDARHVKLGFIELETNVRSVLLAERSNPQSAFGVPKKMPDFPNAWPAWFLAASGLRAYYGSDKGIFLAARASPSEPFSEEVLLLDASVSGPIDGTVWVAPQEDVVFYCSTGPGKSPKLGEGNKGRKLWMIRF